MLKIISLNFFEWKIILRTWHGLQKPWFTNVPVPRDYWRTCSAQDNTWIKTQRIKFFESSKSHSFLTTLESPGTCVGNLRVKTGKSIVCSQMISGLNVWSSISHIGFKTLQQIFSFSGWHLAFPFWAVFSTLDSNIFSKRSECAENDLIHFDQTKSHWIWCHNNIGNGFSPR